MRYLGKIFNSTTFSKFTKIEAVPLVMSTPIDYELRREVENKKYYKTWSQGNTIGKIEGGFDLKGFRDKGAYIVAILDAINERVLYFASFELTPVFDRSLLRQTGLWKDPAQKGLKPSNVIFDYFLQQPGIQGIITDGLQTIEGKNFWVRLVKKAFDKGLHVFYVDIKRGTFFKLLTFNDFKSMEESVWSTYDPESIQRHIVVSKTILWEGNNV